MSEIKDLVRETIKETQKVVPPPLYAVVIHNDDFTPFMFVEFVLCKICKLSKSAAALAASNIHKKGKDVVGAYTREIAETYCTQIKSCAVEYGYPLLAEIQPIE